MSSVGSSNSARTLIESSQGLVKAIAARVHSSVPRYVELDDLIGYGEIGLAEAARDFDPALGTQFSTFAYYRIRGAIYDGLAKMTWTKRRQLREVQYERLAGELLEREAMDASDDGDPSLEERAAALQQFSGKLLVVYLVNFCDGDETSSRRPLLEDAESLSPPAIAALNEIIGLLRQLIDDLPTDAKTLIQAVYFDRRKLSDVAKELRVSRSWASRMHARVLESLAASLRRVGIPDLHSVGAG